jgi:hypothetical protein
MICDVKSMLEPLSNNVRLFFLQHLFSTTVRHNRITLDKSPFLLVIFMLNMITGTDF